MSEALPSTPPPTGPRPSVRWPRRLRATAIPAAILLLCAVLAWAILRWRSEPSAWQTVRRQVAAQAPEGLEAAAKSVELRVTRGGLDQDALASRRSASNGDSEPASAPSRGGRGPTEVRLPLEEINAWMATRLPVWAANQGRPLPPQVTQLSVWTEGPLIAVGFRFDAPRWHQVVSGLFRTEVQPDGRLFVQLTGVRMGRLPVPLAMLPSGGNPEVREALDALAAGQTVDPVWKVPEHPTLHVRLLGVQTAPDALVLTLQAEERSPRR